MSDNELKYISPFKFQLLQSFPFIAEDFDQYTEYQLFCKLVEKMNEVIGNENKVVTLVNEMKNYFDTLDVQDEINNKLNDMAESGELAEIINKDIFLSLNTKIETNENSIDNLNNKIDNINNNLTNDINENSASISSLENRLTNVLNQTPIPVSSTSGMTDTNKIYLLTTDGYWYYYNGSTFVRGGIYQGTATYGVSLDGLIPSLRSKNMINMQTISNNKIIDTGGTLTDDSNYFTSDYIKVEAGVTYYISWVRRMAIYQTDKTFYNIINMSPQVELYEFTPEDDGYIKTSHRKFLKNDIFVSKEDEKIDNYGVKGFVDNTENLTFLQKHKNLINLKNINQFILSNAGQTTTMFNSLYSYIDIPIPAPCTLYLANIRNYTLLNSDKSSSLGASNTEITTLTTLTVSNVNVYYIRCSIRNTKLSSAYVSYIESTNNDITYYGKQTPEDIKIKEDNIISKYYGKKLYAFGDSILYGHQSGISCIDLVCMDKKIEYNKYAVNGAKIVGENNILSQITSAPSTIPDYVIFDGYINDAYSTTTIGEITSDYTTTLDESTFCGAFEKTCKTLKNKYYSSKIIYVAMHKTPTRDAIIQNNLYEKAIAICKKYSIPVVDIYNQGGLNTNLDTLKNLYTYDTLDGYYPATRRNWRKWNSSKYRRI